MPAFRFTGTEPGQYWGWTASPGDVAVFPLAPPDQQWELVIEEEAAPAPPEDPEKKPEGGQDPVRPNKAAPAAEWVAFAKADGTFQEKTGQDPEAESTTRKSIVEFYTGETSEEGS